MCRESFSRSPSPEFFPEAVPSNHEILRTKLTPVLRPGEWGVFKARLTHALVRKTVREWKFTRLTPAQLIVVLRDKLKPKPRPRPPPVTFEHRGHRTKRDRLGPLSPSRAARLVAWPPP